MTTAQKIKKAQLKNLLDENAQLKKIITNMPGCIYWKDKNGVYLGCNKYFWDMVGLTAVEEVIGKTDYDLSWAKQADDLRKHDTKTMLFGTASFEGTATLANGQQLIYTTLKSPLRNAEGMIIGVIGTSLDITQHKKLEEELKIAKEKAEVANHAKSEFLANMSHDVKTPLAGMISIAEMLNSLVQKKHCHLTRDMLDASQHLMVFFENCIELSKLENNSIVLSKETFNLKHLLNEIFLLFQPAVKAKGLTLDLDYDKKIPKHLLGNCVTLYRIVLNLLGNAIKFTSQGSISLRAKLNQKLNKNKVIVKLIISDTGIGIPADKQKQVFERFTRLAPSYEGTYEGSGIGLYIVKEFVKAMSGEISLQSEEGKGSQFSVILPFEMEPLAGGENEIVSNDLSIMSQVKVRLPKNNVSSKISPKVLKPKFTQSPQLKILLVEDNITTRKLAIMTLSFLGYEVDAADCGEKAIALFSPGKYALVFVDIGLPDMNGFEVAKYLRKMEQGTTFHTPIIGLSAHTLQEKEEQLSTAAGMDKMHSKPLLADQAKVLLEQYVIATNV